MHFVTTYFNRNAYSEQDAVTGFRFRREEIPQVSALMIWHIHQQRVEGIASIALQRAASF